MQGIDIRLRWSCPRANGGGDAYRDEDAHFARRQAFGLDDIDSSTHYVEHAAKTLFLMWVTLTEHKWVTLGERRGLDPRDGQRQVIEGFGAVAGGIFDGQARDARFHAQAHTFGYPLGLMRVSRFKVSVHRQLHSGYDLRDVIEYHRSWKGPVRIRQPLREGETGACGREGPEAEMTKIPRRAGVPGIRNDETSALMQLAELIAARRDPWFAKANWTHLI